MKTPLQFSFIIALLFSVPAYGHNMQLFQSMIHFRAEVLSFLNVSVFITALISYKQFFFPGNNNTLPFQVFNIVFVTLFYGLGLPFLIANKAYYEGYETLVPMQVLGKFFLSANFSSVAQWFIIASLPINVLYIIRFRKDYYEAGIAYAGKQEKQPETIALPATAPPPSEANSAEPDVLATTGIDVTDDNSDGDSPYRALASTQHADTAEETTL